MPAPPSRRRPGWCSSPASPPPAPISQYGRSKRAGEVALQQRGDRLPVTILRPGIVYGTRDPKMAAIFQAIARTGIHFTIGFQTPRLSLIHVDDLIDVAIAAAVPANAAGRLTIAYRPAGFTLGLPIALGAALVTLVVAMLSRASK
jgi:nucleoside-diphosphate-sugar epimerase